MEKFMSYLIIIAIIALIVFICYRIVKAEKTRGPVVTKEDFKDDEELEEVIQTAKRGNKPTVVPSEWQVAQLDPRSGNIVKIQNIHLPSGGDYVIGRSEECDFKLDNGEEDVSRKHLGVFRRGGVYCARPLFEEGHAITYIDNRLIKQAFPLTDRQIVFLSDTPIVFIHRGSRRRDLTFDPSQLSRSSGAGGFAGEF